MMGTLLLVLVVGTVLIALMTDLTVAIVWLRSQTSRPRSGPRV